VAKKKTEGYKLVEYKGWLATVYHTKKTLFLCMYTVIVLIIDATLRGW